MTTHSHYNYKRRNSTTAVPYTIPIKHQASSEAYYSYTQNYTQTYSQNYSQNYSHHTHPIDSNSHPSHSHNSHNSHHTHTHSHSHSHSYSQGYNEPHKHEHNDYEEHDDHDEDNYMMSSSVPTLSREFVVRRISEGETGRLKEELKCEACGKGYKHISSLAKHLWEHTPEWNVTKKLLISKHQQVQLLEAASILVGMNDIGSRRNSILEDDIPHSPSEDLSGGYLDSNFRRRSVSIRSRSNSIKSKHDIDEIVGKLES